MDRTLSLYELDHNTGLLILRKLLLYWDGQWFLKTVDEYGNAVGKPRADDLLDAMRLITTYAELLMGAGFRAEFRRLDSDCVDFLIHRCTAYGMAK